MELNEIRDRTEKNTADIAALTGRMDGLSQKVTTLEKNNDALSGIQVALERLSMGYEYMGEKLEELKKSIDRSNEENKKQHTELTDRISAIESAPGKKWENATWIIISGVIMGAVGFALAQLKLLGG